MFCLQVIRVWQPGHFQSSYFFIILNFNYSLFVFELCICLPKCLLVSLGWETLSLSWETFGRHCLLVGRHLGDTCLCVSLCVSVFGRHLGNTWKTLLLSWETFGRRLSLCLLLRKATIVPFPDQFCRNSLLALQLLCRLATLAAISTFSMHNQLSPIASN